MKKCHVALVLLTPPELGGGHNYENSLARLLGSELDLRLTLCLPSGRNSRKMVREATVGSIPETIYYKTGVLSQIGIWLRSGFAGYAFLKLLRKRLSSFEKKLLKAGVDFVYFASPNAVALGIIDLKIVSTVWDLGHRDLPEFPEMRADRKFEEREHYFSRILPKSC